MIALAAHDLTYRFPGAASDAVRHVSLNLEAGRIVAIVGASGSGKSTLLACLAGLLEPTSGQIALASGGPPRPGDVGLVFQNPLHQIVASSLERELAFSLEVRGTPRADMRSRVAESIGALGFRGREHAAPASLSAGECQRLVLRAVLMARSPVLLLDEPTTMLDPAGRDAVLAEVRRLAESGCAVGLVTQFPDETLGAHEVIEMSRGSVVVAGPPRTVVGFHTGRQSREGAPLTSAARLARDASEAGAQIRGGIATIDDLAGAIEAAGEEASGPPARADEGWLHELLGLRGVSLGAAPRSGRYLRDVTLAVERGKATVLVGPTGAGKTTVLLAAAGVVPVDSGARTIEPGCVTATLLQYPERHFTEQSVGDEFEAVAGGRTAGRDPLGVLEELGLDAGVMDRSPFLLSAGEQRRLALALQMARCPDVLIADEPTAGLDPETACRVRTALLRWLRAGGSILAATHDEDLVDALDGTVGVMNEGALAWSGPAARFWEGEAPAVMSLPAWRNLVRRTGIHGACLSRDDLIGRLARGGVRNA